MTNLPNILSVAGVRTVLIVDDAYDPVPLAIDLALDFDVWDIFFSDAMEGDRAVMREIFPAYETTDAQDLRSSDVFVSALWTNRLRLAPELVDPLFQRYEDNKSYDLEVLGRLNNQLIAQGLTCETAGREFLSKAKDADLIFMDLFLGSYENESAQRVSTNGLLKVIEERSDRPPLVVLMSSSTRLDINIRAFRDESGLFESIFHPIGKKDFADESKLTRVLHLLGSHYLDSLKLIRFVNAWGRGIKNAGERTSRLIRRLDLSDHANIKRLLLDNEKQPTGSYLVDVFDRVLQHEVEADAAIIDAARDLNSLTKLTYPPPHGPGVLDLQDLVHRSLFQNKERIRLQGTLGIPVAFGDLLRRKSPPEMATDTSSPSPTSWPGKRIGNRQVLVVLTPACDLQRIQPDDLQSILLLVGTLEPLAPHDWYQSAGDRTPVVEFEGGERFSIRWDPKHFETIQPADLIETLSSPTGLEVIARLRETHALELQQRLLSSLGRVGQVATMPSAFPTIVEAFYTASDGKLARLDLPGCEGSNAICYRGPVGNSMVTCLVPSIDLCDAIDYAVKGLDIGLVCSNSREAVNHLKTSSDLWHVLTPGIYLPEKAKSLKVLDSPTVTVINGKGEVVPKNIGLITRNAEVKVGFSLNGSYTPTAGVILAIRELTPPTQDTDLDPEIV